MEIEWTCIMKSKKKYFYILSTYIGLEFSILYELLTIQVLKQIAEHPRVREYLIAMKTF